MEALELRDLRFKYPNTDKYVIDGIGLDIKEGSFVLLCGGTGCGKTTLLRLIKHSLSPHGDLSGSISVFGKEPKDMSVTEEAQTVGMVMQRPENQIISENCVDELAFGLSNLGVPTDIIHRRIAEVSGYFGMDHWINWPIMSLSGGQKQILNLASVIAMRPSLLLLDEPTSRLDPISAAEFTSAVTRLNRETGITVIMAEHRLESVFPLCDRVLYMQNGVIAVDATPEKAAALMAKNASERSFLPPAPRIFASAGREYIPLTVKDARRKAAELLEGKTLKTGKEDNNKTSEPLLIAKNLYFRYEKTGKDVLKNCDIVINRGEIISVMGGNAAGKTTLLKCIAGLLKPYAGNVKINGKKLSSYTKQELYGGILSYLPQDVNAVFNSSTVADELAECKEIPEALKPYLNTHPYDLSGGEQQKCALAKALAKSPVLLLLDEPTKGLDPLSVAELAQTLKDLSKKGIAVVCVTHDSEFASSISDSLVLMFDGSCCEKIPPAEFFCGNSFYTTAAAAITRGYVENVYTSEQLCDILKEAKL